MMSHFDASAFGKLAPHWKLHYFTETDSTSAQARAACEVGEAVSGLLFLADSQSSGVGRRGTRWSCPTGQGLLFTAVLETELESSDIGKLAIAAGLAVAEVIQSYGVTPQLKWPNDIYIQSQKVCGILVEQVAEFSLFGIGINTHVNEFPDGLEATSLAHECVEIPSREEILAAVLNSLISKVSCIESQFSSLLEQWDQVDYLKGMPLNYVDKGLNYTGVGYGLSEQGFLLVETNGQLVALSSASQISVG